MELHEGDRIRVWHFGGKKFDLGTIVRMLPGGGLFVLIDGDWNKSSPDGTWTYRESSRMEPLSAVEWLAELE